jgi:peptidyl-prolyl cis-trans isomerase D
VLQSMRSAAKYIWIILVIAFVGGFLLVETSGLLGRAPVTTGTAVATVNGEDVLYQTWATASQQRIQMAEQQGGRSLTLDDRRRIENETFDELVQAVLLQQEYERRGIRVTEEEIVQAAQTSPPPQLLQAPDLQTDGRFDLEKYRRFLNSPAARQQGLLVQLENYYRSEIPRAKLFDRIASEVYVSEARLWQSYRDQHDTAVVTFASFAPSLVADSAVSATDAELRSYYDAHRAEFERPARAAVSLLVIPRTVTASDSAAVRDRLVALRNEIVGGARFEDVARRESADTISGRDGGSLGRGPKGRFVAEFENAALALTPGEISQPVLTPFGYHLIKVDERKGDTLSLRHILLRIQQSDSTATRTDRRADSLANIAAAQEEPARLDSASRVLGLPIQRAVAFEGEPLMLGGRQVPSVSAWALGGAQAGETSDLFDSDDAYYLARVDTIVEGGIPAFDDVKEVVRGRVLGAKKLDKLMADAARLASAAAGSTLEAAAQQQGITVTQTPPFTRAGFASGLGRLNEAVGASFSLPIGQVSAPIRTEGAVFVLRVDRRVEADRAKFEAQKSAQRTQVLDALRQQRVRAFLEELRESAKIEDRRKEINTQLTRQAS